MILSISGVGFLIPYSGTSVAEYLREHGYDVIICYDDLVLHAKAYRQISLVQGRVPCRDAYPSDVFNIHGSLLERSVKAKYGGSITAFPIVETISEDISEYIATNVISILTEHGSLHGCMLTCRLKWFNCQS